MCRVFSKCNVNTLPFLHYIPLLLLLPNILSQHLRSESMALYSTPMISILLLVISFVTSGRANVCNTCSGHGIYNQNQDYRFVLFSPFP